MKPLRQVGLLALFMGGLSAAQAQSPTLPLSSVTGLGSPRQWLIKFAPLSLLDPSNTVQFAVERLVSPQHAVQVEFGYGWQGMNLWNHSRRSRYSDYEVWRGRAEWRYYWRRHRGPIGSYTALEGLYKQENAFEHGTVGIGTADSQFGQYQYYQLYSQPVSKQVWALHLKIGRQFALSANNRLVADFYGGIGVRHGTIQGPNRPDGYNFYQSSGFLVDPFSSNLASSITISASYGIKFGYAF